MALVFYRATVTESKEETFIQPLVRGHNPLLLRGFEICTSAMKTCFLHERFEIMSNSIHCDPPRFHRISFQNLWDDFMVNIKLVLKNTSHRILAVQTNKVDRKHG